MKRVLFILCIAVIIAATLLALVIVDKNTKSVAGFLDSNRFFEITDRAVTILNEEIRLK